MLKLHHHPFSTFSRRVRIALIEKNIDCELVEVDMMAGAHRSEAYRKLNPYGRVPTLEEDGLVLYESTAILEYLEATHPQPPLVPADARGRALVAMHMKLCDIQLARQTGTIIFPMRFLPKERWDEAAMAQAKKEIEKHLVILDAQLASKSYLVGDRYSLAEVCYAPFVEFFPLMKIAPPPNVAAWTKSLLERPSAVQTKPAA
ncbi:MAG: glutathione S-transferase family protein [Deltaproteobacteria bacterium]|nr:glutathione S-transferase family protein [Deltaproteobacteria bacterium]MBI3388550.1 glutathione S-transferase family protein [Deltaproteobacteria bacterium]